MGILPTGRIKNIVLIVGMVEVPSGEVIPGKPRIDLVKERVKFLLGL